MAHGSAHTIVPFDLEEEPSQLDPLDAPEPPPMTPIPTARLPSQQRLEPEAWVPGRLIPLPHVADRAADDASDDARAHHRRTRARARTHAGAR